MSAYGKPPPPQHHGNGYDTSRTFSESTFSYATPVYGPSSGISNASTPAFPEASPMTQIAYPPSQPRASFDEQAGPYLNVGSTPTPVVKDFSPQRGASGNTMRVTITTFYELLTSEEPTFFLMFGQRKVGASLMKTNQQGSICQYFVDAEIPQLAATGWSSSQVPVSMFMESKDGDVMAKVDVGKFSYVSASSQSSLQEGSRKRKLSFDAEDMSPAKRISNQHLRPKEEYGQYDDYTSNQASNYAGYLQPGANIQPASYSGIPAYNRVANYQAQIRNMAHPYSAATALPTMKSEAPHGNWDPSYPPLASNTRSPGYPPNSGLSRSAPSMSSPRPSSNPPLVRTTRLPQSPSPGNTPHGGQPVYNSFSSYHHRAKLELKGDLGAMAVGWSADEWDAKRRLVVFKRSQLGSTITTTFSPVAPDERPPHSICVSCIMWEDKKECFITSVDTISLLEQLVAARFTVEEKNRIRRNLEGFRPLTVSKAKADSADFFGLIMQFPSPKPRNIEKDVKVFHWKDLTSALKKIIGKYSASPSSTLPPPPALLTPVSSTGYVTEGSTLSYAGDHHGPLSPRSISTTSTGYPNPNHNARMSPQNQKSMALQVSSDMRVAVPHPHDSISWQQQGGHQMQSPYQRYGPQSSRSWDTSSNYLESPANVGNSAQSQNLDFATPRTAGLPEHPGDSRRLSTSRVQSHQVPHS